MEEFPGGNEEGGAGIEDYEDFVFREATKMANPTGATISVNNTMAVPDRLRIPPKVVSTEANVSETYRSSGTTEARD